MIIIRLWHQLLIPYLNRQRLLSQHRELCALRGKGWGRRHATVDYVFTHDPAHLVAYHALVMDEMIRRGYNPDRVWYKPQWRGSVLQEEVGWCDENICSRLYNNAEEGAMVYPEHNEAYLKECINLLKQKEAPIDWEIFENEILIKGEFKE